MLPDQQTKKILKTDLFVCRDWWILLEPIIVQIIMLLTTLIHDSLSILQETGGVTIDINGNCIAKPQNYWMFPKYPSKTLIIPITTDINREVLAYIEKNRTFLNESDCFLGIWINPKTNEYYLDITTTRESKEQALDDARQYSIEQGRNIVAIYNPLINKTIYL